MMTHWLQWIAAFVIVIGILSVAAGLQQWWEWRKENRKMTAEEKMSRAMRKVIVTVVVLILLVVGAVWMIGRALAQGHEHHSAAGRFYKTWMMPDNRNVSCCHDEDCKPSQSRLRNGKWQARYTDADEWTDIPAPKIETERDSPDGRSHLCARKALGGVTVLCFAPGSGT